MTLSVFRRMAFAGLRNYLISACVLGFVMVASGQDQAVHAPARPAPERTQIRTESGAAITLDPPTGWDLQVHAFDAQGNALPEAPANFRRLGEAKAGEAGDVHTLTLRFSEAVTLTHIKLTPDFRIEQGGSCVEGSGYEGNTTCTLLVRFTPQGPGRRLGRLLISHSGSATPDAFGLGGYGYAPVINFIPSVITTVPGTVSSGAGTISGVTNLAIDGGDILYIPDSGNNLIKEIDSSGAITSISPAFTAPGYIAVDSYGNIYNVNSSATYTFSYITPWGVQTAYGYTYVPSTCTASAPCAFSAVGIGSPSHLSIDADDDLFFEESTTGAAEMPIGGLSGGSGTLNLWHLADEYAYSGSQTPQSFAVDASGNLYTSYNYSVTNLCSLLEEQLYAAESSPSFTRIAGASKCGFSGDGGQARGAEISSPIGQIAFDIAGDLYFADAGNQRVRRIDYVTGVIRTIAGNGTAGYTGDGGKATSATLHNPTGVAVNSQGAVYIISSAASGQVIRKVGSPGLIAFPNQGRGLASAAQFVTVTNTGNAGMTLTNAVITGANAADFKVDNTTTTCMLTAGAVLYGGQTCRIGVIFTPAAVGARAATLTLLDNTINGADSVTISGTGVLPTPTFKITAPANGSSFTSGTAVTFSVSVTSASGPQPTGKVQFKVDGANYGSAVTVSSTGTASTSVTGLTTTSHTLAATYSGDSNYAAAGPVSVSITITAAAVVKFTAPVATQELKPTTQVTLAVTVTASKGPAPTGSVNFSVDGKSVSTAAIVSGKASVKGGVLAAGTHTLVAAYSGNKYHPASKASKKITVSP